MLTDADASAFIAPMALSGKLSIRRTPTDQLAQQTPRAVLRVASRGHNPRGGTRESARVLEPFLQDLQNDVARLSRAFATLGREANALVRSEAEIRARIENGSRPANPPSTANGTERTQAVATADAQPAEAPNENENAGRPLSRSARRRMRLRLRAALNAPQPPVSAPVNRPVTPAQRQNGHIPNNPIHIGLAIVQQPPVPPPPVPFPGFVAANENSRSNRRRRQRR